MKAILKCKSQYPKTDKEGVDSRLDPPKTLKSNTIKHRIVKESITGVSIGYQPDLKEVLFIVITEKESYLVEAKLYMWAQKRLMERIKNESIEMNCTIV